MRAQGLDKIDLLMLENLQKNGRMSNVDLSKVVGISPPPCLRRLRRLEESGIIMGYHAKVDLNAIGCGFEAFCVVTMKNNASGFISAFVNKVQNMASVLSCMIAMGSKEFILRIIARDYNEFDRITQDIAVIKGVGRIKPYIIVRTHKDTTEIQLSKIRSKVVAN